jgi:hypothetical protein
MTASQPQMFRILTWCVVVALAAGGVAPCAMPRAAAGLGSHDCCDPDEIDAAGPAGAAAAMLVPGLPACCLVSTTDPGPAAPPVANPTPPQRPGAAFAGAPFVADEPAALPRLTTRDLRARSAPRPPLVPVLLV